MNNDEVAQVNNLGRYQLNSFVIRWELTRFCNYSCDFCVQGSHESHLKAFQSESGERRKMIAASIARYIERFIPAGKIVEISLIGGEITALPDFKDNLAEIVNCNFRGIIIIRITTNFSRPSRYFSDLFELFHGRSDRALFVSASFYRRYTAPDAFGKKLRALFEETDKPVKRYFRLRQRLLSFIPGRKPFFKNWQNVFISVGWPILDDDSYRDFRQFQKDYGRYARQVFPIIIRNYPVALSDSIRAALKTNGASGSPAGNSLEVKLADGRKMYFSNMPNLGNHISDAGKFCPYGYLCDAGCNSMSIAPDGRVLRCPTIDAPDDFYLGNITDDSFRLLDKSAVCHSGHCSCNSFKTIRKK